MINKLEDKIYSEQHHQAPVIDFEKMNCLPGLNGWISCINALSIKQRSKLPISRSKQGSQVRSSFIRIF